MRSRKPLSQRATGRAAGRMAVAALMIMLIFSPMYVGDSAVAAEDGSTFVDDNGSVHEGAIEALAEAGITAGCNPAGDRYCPEDGLTRGQAAAFFTRALGLSDSDVDHFWDDNDSIFEFHINALADGQIARGCSADGGQFCPDDAVTRGQWASFLARAMDLAEADTDHFDDDDGNVHEDDINRLAEAGITNGCDSARDAFCPDSTVTRGQAASFLARALDLPIETITVPAPELPAFWGEGFPSPETTGPRVGYDQMTEVDDGLTTTHDGQIIDRMDITGNLKVIHDNVTVRDSRISFTNTYGLFVDEKADGSCPTGTVFEYIELDGRLAAENDIPIYSPGCEWTLDHAYVHNVGRSSRMKRNVTITNSFIYSSRTGDSGAHRGAIGLNGGRNNTIVNNTLLCEGSGCSASLAMYGDTAPIENILVQHNLMAATAAYCAYGGSVSSKPYPEASNVRFIDNHFSTLFFEDCGRAGPITSFDENERGNVWEGNVWHETGEPIAP